jgi:hypothetical protein
MSDESHTYHDALPNYHPDQILIDGCPVCEERSRNVSRAIENLDHQRFAAAWLRAADTFASTPPSGATPPFHQRSNAEMPLLTALWAIQLAFERLGLPLGYLPAGDTTTAAVTPFVPQSLKTFTVALPEKVAIR